MPNPQQDADSPAGHSHPPWQVNVAGVLSLAATAVWIVGTYWFWFFHPLLPALGALAYGIAIIVAWCGNRTARIVATIVGLLESFSYGPGGLVAVALCLTSLIMLYLPRSNAYFGPALRHDP